MDRDDIMKLTAEELRMAIAKAKGMKVEWQFPSIVDGFNLPNKYPVDISTNPPPWRRIEIPDWPTSISDAWGLVGELRGAKGAMELISHDNGTYFCVFAKELPNMAGSSEFCISADADTAPMAISRAWLMWNGGAS